VSLAPLVADSHVKIFLLHIEARDSRPPLLHTCHFHLTHAQPKFDFKLAPLLKYTACMQVH